MVEAIGRGRFAPADTIDPAEQSALFFLAMGKYGAHELNYSSDIDFSCYFNAERLPVASGVEPREFAVRLTQAAVGLMQETTATGTSFGAICGSGPMRGRRRSPFRRGRRRPTTRRWGRTGSARR